MIGSSVNGVMLRGESPQGSVLRSVLFVLFINDLPSVVQSVMKILQMIPRYTTE